MDATFDTLAYAKKLENVGVDRRQAEVQAEALKDFGESQNRKILADLATRASLREAELRIELKMQAMKNRIRNWLVGSMLALAAFLVGATSMIISWMPR